MWSYYKVQTVLIENVRRTLNLNHTIPLKSICYVRLLLRVTVNLLSESSGEVTDSRYIYVVILPLLRRTCQIFYIITTRQSYTTSD